MKKVISAISNVLIAIVFTFAVIFGVSTIKEGHPNFCGYQAVQVLSTSMVDSGINRGDVKLIHSADDYHVGDIVAFYYESGNDTVILYHEIIDTTDDGGFITKGSSNKLPEAKTTYASSIIGRQVNDGNYKFLVSLPFKLTLILIPYALAMAYIIWIVINIIKDEKRIKNASKLKRKKVKIGSGQKKLRKKIRKSHGWKTRSIIVILSLLCCGEILLQGYAAAQDNLITTNTISFIVEKMTWTNSDILPEDTYQAATDFESALNNPDSAAGQAWIKAWNEKHTIGNSYVGSMDNRADDDLAIVFGTDASYIIKRRNNNEYDLYVTYETLNRGTGTVQPVYRTKFTRPDADSEFIPVQSWVGRCNRNIYSATQSLFTYAFDTESFTQI